MDNRYLSLHELARATRLPAAWLKREAEAPRLPCLRAGRRRMFDLDAVRAALAVMTSLPTPQSLGAEGDRHA